MPVYKKQKATVLHTHLPKYASVYIKLRPDCHGKDIKYPILLFPSFPCFSLTLGSTHNPIAYQSHQANVIMKGFVSSHFCKFTLLTIINYMSFYVNIYFFTFVMFYHRFCHCKNRLPHSQRITLNASLYNVPGIFLHIYRILYTYHNQYVQGSLPL